MLYLRIKCNSRGIRMRKHYIERTMTLNWKCATKLNRNDKLDVTQK